MRSSQIIWYILPLCLCSMVFAKRNLVATSLVTCMENSQVSSKSFDVVFDPDNRSLHYNLDMTTQIDSYITADIDVYAYGFKIISKQFDVCSQNWKQFCPVHPGNIQINSIEYISKEYVDEIPGIAYNVPDIDAYVRVNILNNYTERVACVQVYFSNGKTVSQTGVKWATAVIAGIGLLLSAVLSTYGNSTAASHISANTMTLFLYFQSVAVIGMQHVHSVPPIAAAWCENLAWSMGLIYVKFMQKIFRWYVQSTGGTPDLYLTSTSQSVLTQRSWDSYLQDVPLVRRATNVLFGNQNTLIFRGIKRVGYSMGIENTSIVCTGFTFFVLCGYVLAGFVMVCKYSIELSIRAGWIKQGKFIEFRENWRVILKGSLLRYIYIGFTQLTILAFWEFTERDSAAVIVIACLFLLLSVGLMVWAGYRTCYFANRSIETYNNPAALLYGDERVLNKYGFFYTMFNATHYWWNILLLSYIFIKSLFIGFAQGSGKTQALATFILDLCYMVAVIRYQPYLDRPTNILNICMSSVTVVNSFIFMFFSDLFGQPYQVSAIMGWVFFILNAAFSFILLMMVLTYTGLIIFSKNPDIRFKPAKDDRTSFQRRGSKGDYDNSKKVNEDLMALGNIAKDHADNWEENLNNNSRENIFLGSDEENEKYYSGSNVSVNKFGRKPTLSEKIFNKFSRKSRNPANLNIDNNNYNGEKVEREDYEYNASSTSKSTSPTKKNYPGLNHTRPRSDSDNGLMGSYENEGMHFEQPNGQDLRSRVESTSSDMMERDYSLGSLQHEQHKTDILKNDFL